MKTTIRLLWFLLASIGACVACTQVVRNELGPTAKSSLLTGSMQLDEDDLIREAVFRHQFSNNASSKKTAAEFYCLAINDGDPSLALLMRFKDHHPPVVPISECVRDPHNGVTHDKLQGKGLVFGLDKIRRTSRTEAILEGGYYEAGLSASGNTYTVRFMDGEWKVVSDRMNWIS